ncbi:Uncharacterized protein TCM_019835 [Theobroma cacao]|uniref:Uncharacterized protein n=1 Tax=Theobroma cacao TaxID=3641 RepID=A0A061EID3_THECC|nr:Uncharacterized protein TCM_019835 [Theobroma cacao]
MVDLSPYLFPLLSFNQRPNTLPSLLPTAKMFLPLSPLSYRQLPQRPDLPLFTHSLSNAGHPKTESPSFTHSLLPTATPKNGSPPFHSLSL